MQRGFLASKSIPRFIGCRRPRLSTGGKTQPPTIFDSPSRLPRESRIASGSPFHRMRCSISSRYSDGWIRGSAWCSTSSRPSFVRTSTVWSRFWERCRNARGAHSNFVTCRGSRMPHFVCSKSTARRCASTTTTTSSVPRCSPPSTPTFACGATNTRPSSVLSGRSVSGSFRQPVWTCSCSSSTRTTPRHRSSRSTLLPGSVANERRRPKARVSCERARAGADSCLRMPHIFVTEEDPDIRTSIADVLAEEGYEVREFCNGEDTLRELKGGSRPCVLLLDLLMPEMGGQQLLDAIRCDPSLAQIAVVVITGAKAPAVDAEVLSKPFELGD